MKIAIIGSGISGLTAAHHLHRRHEITLFEADQRIGGHTHTVTFDLDGRSYAIDTGFIVFNETNYPNFVHLLDDLQVASQPTIMSFSVRCDRTGLEYGSHNLNSLFAQRMNLFRGRFWKMLLEILRFNRQSPALLQDAEDWIKVEDYVRQKGYSREFLEHFLTPLGSALWSCPAGKFRQFPMRFVVEFLHNHAMLQASGQPIWRVIQGGSFKYVEALVKPFRERIQLRCPVRSVTRKKEQVQLTLDNSETVHFDQVIFACHADQALALLTDASPLEREVLEAFPYQSNEAILHTDTSVLPRNRRAWGSWNYRVEEKEHDQVSVTYYMNSLQGFRSEPDFCVTLNDRGEIAPSRIIRRIRYDHPLYTTRRSKAQKKHSELIGFNRTSYCGAYWGYGFHEDGVRSARAVCEKLRQFS